MKGAKGLLISITGGRDLTLYEVDEAATRIREEVDQDANIIVGATFDEQLEGIIRVSVVATGIDQAAAAGRPSAPEARLAELAHKLRADQQRLSERAPVTTPYVSASMLPMNPDAIESAKAAVAAAVLPINAADDVTIRPMQPKPSLFLDPTAAESHPQELPPPGAFIPPQPDRAGRTGRTMPRLEDLPMPGQNELRAKRGEAPAADHPEKRRMGLLQRLASVGLGRRDEMEETDVAMNARPDLRPVPPGPDQRIPAASESRPTHRPLAQRSGESRQSDPVSEYAKRPVHQGLDPLGRQASVHNSPEEDHLEIPAFLRRQAT
jgi:cell division protein FtsZ